MTHRNWYHASCSGAVAAGGLTAAWSACRACRASSLVAVAPPVVPRRWWPPLVCLRWWCPLVVPPAVVPRGGTGALPEDPRSSRPCRRPYARPSVRRRCLHSALDGIFIVPEPNARTDPCRRGPTRQVRRRPMPLPWRSGVPSPGCSGAVCRFRPRRPPKSPARNCRRCTNLVARHGWACRLDFHRAAADQPGSWPRRRRCRHRSGHKDWGLDSLAAPVTSKLRSG